MTTSTDNNHDNNHDNNNGDNHDNNHGATDGARYDAIRPGQLWLDTNGNRIQAHGGSMFYENDTFYWYGENKEHTKTGSGIWHWGIRCYSSTDLCNWTDLGLIIPPDEDDPTSPLHPKRQMDRPHIVFNEPTQKYLCWVKVMGHGHTQLSTVLTADHLLGPYTKVHVDFRPLGMNAGDFDLVVDPSDGKAYYYFERVHSELICADLTDDYTDVTGYYSTHFALVKPPAVREAPAHFVRNGLHYLITSGTTGYFPNESQVATAPSYHGPWTLQGDPHPGDSFGTSYRSQVSCVFQHPTIDDLYIAMADRWLPWLPIEHSNVSKRSESGFATEEEAAAAIAAAPPQFSDPDTSIADYVWLPIRFDGDNAYLDWLDEWTPQQYV